MRKRAADALAPFRSNFTPPSYDHSVIGASVGSTMIPSLERKPRATLPYTPNSGVSRNNVPTFGENTAWVAETAAALSGSDRVPSASNRAPTSRRQRSVRLKYD